MCVLWLGVFMVYHLNSSLEELAPPQILLFGFVGFPMLGYESNELVVFSEVKETSCISLCETQIIQACHRGTPHLIFFTQERLIGTI